MEVISVFGGPIFGTFWNILTIWLFFKGQIEKEHLVSVNATVLRWVQRPYSLLI